MLRLRVISAVFGIPLILGLVYLGDFYYALLLLAVALLGMREYLLLLKLGFFSLTSLIGYLGITAVLLLIYLEWMDLFFALFVVLFLLLFLTVLLKMETTNFRESALVLWGIIYMGGFCGYMLLLRRLTDGFIYTLILFGAAWVNDTVAYMVGMKWGRRRLAPKISPKKSLEGSLAGLTGTVVLIVAASLVLPERLFPLQPIHGFLLAVGLSVCAQLGDLLESALKRQLEIKDSGKIIPGHGGILDRFDSLLLAAPFIYYFFILAT